MARPTKFTRALGLTICKRIAEGESVRSIAKDEKMPAASTIFLWVINGDHKEFSEQYGKSREVQADLMFEEMLEIADDGSNDFMEREIADGVKVEQYNSEHVQRSRLRVDLRKWALSKMLPKRFGEKMETVHSGKVDINPAASFIEALRKGRE